MRNKFKYLNPNYYLATINDYGYPMKPWSFLLWILISIVIIVIVGVYFMLEKTYLFILSLCILICMPYAILSYFRNLYIQNNFNQLRQYLHYSYLHFGMIQSIPNTLKEVEEFVDGKIKTSIKNARERFIEYEGKDYYEYALAPIEDVFLNSRVKSFHQFMKDVELKSSTHFQEILDNLKLDFNQYVERTLIYQLELKMIKRNFKIAVVICLLISGTLCSFYRNYPTLSTFTDNRIYQWVTLFYLIGLFLIFIMSEIRLHGRWLHEDLGIKKEDKYVKYIQDIRHYSSKNNQNRKRFFFLWIVFSIIGYYLYPSLLLWIVFVLIGGITLFHKTLTHKKRKRIISRVINREFPNWLNSIALLLNDRIVPVAIKETQNSSFILEPYIQDLVNEIEEDSKSMLPYCHFLSEYHNNEITNTMKTLYSIQNQMINPAKAIHDLVKQNQRMLSESEKIRNADSLAAIGFSIHTTTLLFMLKTTCDLFLLIVTAIQVMRGMI